MNEIERESIILNCAWEMIDEMVNYLIFVKFDHSEPTNLLFNGDTQARFFVILLGDFLSEIRAFRGPVPLGLSKVPSNVRTSDLTYLFHLRQVCRAPELGSDATRLSNSIEVFADWLEGKFVACNVHFANLGFVTNLCVERQLYIKMCGDIAKHNLAHLSANAGRLKQLLKQAKHPIDEHDIYLAIDDFFNWFFDDIFIYHSSQIAEFLNNIRWEIFYYLKPEFNRSWHPTAGLSPDLTGYSYHIPEGIAEPIARAMYWKVMNQVSRGILFPRFVIPEILKSRY